MLPKGPQWLWEGAGGDHCGIKGTMVVGRRT